MLTVIFLFLTDSDDHSILKWNLLSDETTQVNILHFALIALFLSYMYMSFQVFNFFTMNFVILNHRSLSYQQKYFQLIYTGFHEVLEAKNRASLSCSSLPLLMVTKLIANKY